MVQIPEVSDFREVYDLNATVVALGVPHCQSNPAVVFDWHTNWPIIRQSESLTESLNKDCICIEVQPNMLTRDHDAETDF